MANKFVWSGATGANDGSSWDNAYTSLMRDWGAEAGFTPATDVIGVRSVHSETSGSTLTITGGDAESTTARCRIICVVGDTTGTALGNLATGASVNTNAATADIVIAEGIYIYGVEFLSNNDVSLAGTVTDHDVCLEQCRLELIGTDSGDSIVLGPTVANGVKITLLNCVMDFAATGQGIYMGQSATMWRGGSVEYDVDVLIRTPAPGYKGHLIISDIDMSALSSSALINGATNVFSDQWFVFSRCLLGSGSTVVSGTIDISGFRVESYHCQIGTDADPAYQMEIQDSRGKIVTDTARYRTGGGSDDVRATPIAWDFDTTAGSVRGYPGHALEGPPMPAWSPGDGSTAHTYRIAFASDATINDDELWMELEGPNDAATNSLAALKTTRVAPRTTAAAYTTDSGSTWTGTGVGTKQYMQITYTPDKPGPVVIRVHMAKASDNVYIDPLIQIDPA